MKVVGWARDAALCSLAVLAASVGVGCDDEDPKPDAASETVHDGGQHGDAGLSGQQGRPDGSIVLGADGAVINNPPHDGGQQVSSPFAIRGRLASAPGDKRIKAPGDAAVEHSITHVMAVNPATSNPVRHLTPLAADGTFTLGVDLNTPWVIVLVDGHFVGKDMIAGVFRSEAFDLDSVAATRPGMLDLGDLNVDGATGEARATVSTVSLLTALGLSQSAATLLGSMDDISLRYVNPDIDGNGKIDVEENVSYPLDFHLRYTMQRAGQPIPYTGLLNRFADPADTEADYGLGSAIAYWQRPDQFGVTVPTDFRIRFADASGNYWGMPSGSFVAGAWITDVGAFYQSAGTNSVGITFDDTMPFPVGEYAYEVKGTQLTYTNVRTHSLADLNAGPQLMIPFLSLTTNEPGCEGWSCTIKSIDYKWMRRAGSGVRWVAASAEEVALLVPARGGFFGFAPGGDLSKRLEYVIPGDPVSGTIALNAPGNIQGGVTQDEIVALTVGQLCHVGISYDDTLGMRMFQGWGEGPNCIR